MSKTEMQNVFHEAPPLSENDQRLVELYKNIGRTLDDLPYTAEFDTLYARAHGQGDTRSKHEIFRRLSNLRKAARLPRLGRGASPTLNLSDAEVEILEDLIPRFAGTVGQRDKLPYTHEFEEELVPMFNRDTSRELTPHAVWRLVARIAK